MIKSKITLKQLEAFAFVVDMGTFRAAASALGTTQPNISARISALETSLGVTLLTRDAGSVQLTEIGRSLLQKTREVLWAGEALLEGAMRQDLIEDRLRLGVTELVACTWLQDFLRLLKSAYPNVRVELLVDLSTTIDARLTQGTLDLAFQSAPFKADMTGSIPIGAEAYRWMARPEMTASLGQSPAMSSLFAHPILTHARDTQAGDALHDMAAKRGLDPRQIVHSSALSACVPLACEGLGIALLPERLVQQEIEANYLQIIQSDWTPEPLAFFARYAADRAPLFVQRAAQLAPDAMKQNADRTDVG